MTELQQKNQLIISIVKSLVLDKKGITILKLDTDIPFLSKINQFQQIFENLKNYSFCYF